MTENPTALSDFLQQGVDWLLAIGCPEDSEVIRLAQDVHGRVAWLEDREYITGFYPPTEQVEPSLPWLLGLLRVTWAKTNKRGSWDAAEAAGDVEALNKIKSLNSSSRRLRDILESAQADEEGRVWTPSSRSAVNY